ncbi:hypothetical protein EXIGLDRAFT_724314 [Exidia glandulosa HHB12029]|uniref:Uncharacterized protein n=1 Tax=Exidia glandulosa HHB12029 TaxID=1314781 RepID=A0A165MU92_EXIGL|nr:hypothetical protein EXIGLDRAFT_724314 [Exidia glandulosa HHB12029]
MQVTRVRLLYEALTPDGIPPPWPEPVIPALYFGPEVGTSTAPPAPVMGVIPLSEPYPLPHSYSNYPLPAQQQYPNEYFGDESYEPERSSDNDADSMYTASQGGDSAET